MDSSGKGAKWKGRTYTPKAKNKLAIINENSFTLFFAFQIVFRGLLISSELHPADGTIHSPCLPMLKSLLH